VIALLNIILQVLTDLAGTVYLAVRRQGPLAAEILMLRRQLAMYVERGVTAASRSCGVRIRTHTHNLRIRTPQEYKIVQGLASDDFSRGKMRATHQELCEERDGVKVLI